MRDDEEGVQGTDGGSLRLRPLRVGLAKVEATSVPLAPGLLAFVAVRGGDLQYILIPAEAPDDWWVAE